MGADANGEGVAALLSCSEILRGGSGGGFPMPAWPRRDMNSKSAGITGFLFGFILCLRYKRAAVAPQSALRANRHRSSVVLGKTKPREHLVVQRRRIPQNRDRYRLSQLDPLHSIRPVMHSC